MEFILIYNKHVFKFKIHVYFCQKKYKQNFLNASHGRDRKWKENIEQFIILSIDNPTSFSSSPTCFLYSIPEVGWCCQLTCSINLIKYIEFEIVFDISDCPSKFIIFRGMRNNWLLPINAMSVWKLFHIYGIKRNKFS